MRGRGVPVVDGAYLFVGIDSAQIGKLGDFVTRAFAWGIGAMLLIGLAGGALMSLSEPRHCRPGLEPPDSGERLRR
jgi:hypothetical protein